MCVPKKRGKSVYHRVVVLYERWRIITSNKSACARRAQEVNLLRPLIGGKWKSALSEKRMSKCGNRQPLSTARGEAML